MAGRVVVNGEWYSQTPDGRDVVVRRRGETWLVRCGSSWAQSTNLDVALTQAIRDELEVDAHAHEIDYPTWIRTVADRIDPEA
jgi:hypothetical protein